MVGGGGGGGGERERERRRDRERERQREPETESFRLLSSPIYVFLDSFFFYEGRKQFNLTNFKHRVLMKGTALGIKPFLNMLVLHFSRQERQAYGSKLIRIFIVQWVQRVREDRTCIV